MLIYKCLIQADHSDTKLLFEVKEEEENERVK